MSRYKKFSQADLQYVEVTEMDLLEKDFTGYKCNLVYDVNNQQEIDEEFVVESCQAEALEDDDVLVTRQQPAVPTDTLMVSGYSSTGEFFSEVYETRFNPEICDYIGFHLYELEHTKTGEVYYEIQSPDNQHVVAAFYE